MRLLNTGSLELEEVSDEFAVEYVILSHRWEDEEVLFQDIDSLETAKRLKGFSKVKNFCMTARKNEYMYAWMDTVCIDKTSSSELAEAINSMFRWYRNAAECYVYLSDVSTSASGFNFDVQFVSSKWFKRGWTLQELLAPRAVQFLNAYWQPLGTKIDLIQELYTATGIVRDALQGRDVLQFSTAERMSWAADRKTKRIEDRAYSLMGIFNVNMPMIYGEGSKAFIRLQNEIIKHSSNDFSIFAWTGVPSNGSGLLASSPDCFAQSRGFVSNRTNPSLKMLPMSPRGLNICTNLTPWNFSVYVAQLPCAPPGRALAGIFLRKISNEQYRRVQVDEGLDFLFDTSFLFQDDNYKRPNALENIYVVEDGLASSVLSMLPSTSFPLYGIKVALSAAGDIPLDFTPYILNQGNWDQVDKIARFHPGFAGEVVQVNLSEIDPELRVARIGLDWSFRPRCVITGRKNDPSKANQISLHLLNKGLFYSNPRKGAVVMEIDSKYSDIYRNLWALELPSSVDETSLVLYSRLSRLMGPIANVSMSIGVRDSVYIWDVQINLLRAKKVGPWSLPKKKVQMILLTEIIRDNLFLILYEEPPSKTLSKGRNVLLSVPEVRC